MDSKKIIQKFTTLVVSTCKSLEANEVTLEKVVLLLKGFKIEGLSECKNITQALVCAGEYWSFFNYGVLETLISNLGDEDDKMRLDTYISEFKEYCKRRLCEVPIAALQSDRNITTRLHVKTDRHFIVPLEDVSSLARELSELLDTTLLLLDIKDGCMELVFDCLKTEKLLCLQSDDKDRFMQLSITKLYTEKQVFYQQHDDSVVPNSVVEEERSTLMEKPLCKFCNYKSIAHSQRSNREGLMYHLTY